ncbi:MAG: N-acetylmuramoyl-L-alanine amidase [Bacteroidales bacterium]|nr:N-acetylmuramoyl-L-alanine amidase [Bacteroidales bacterium]
MEKRLINILICCLFVLPLSAQQGSKTAQKAAQKKAFTVVIDAGHGGHDPGAMGKLTQEKKLNLEVSQRLEQQIKLHHPDVKVVMTRKNDVFLTLQQRADIVNKNNADLFICIHTNAAENRNVTGTETFVLGVDKMQSNLDVAMRENAVMLLEDDYQTTYEGFDPNSVDSYIMFELMQDQYIDQSLNFATLVQHQFTDIGRSDRGVRQAGFWVLHKSACPSVLIEMGFISNINEEKYLASDKGKEDITNSIYQAFEQYKSAYDRKHGIVKASQAESKPVEAKAAKPAEAKANKPEEAAKPAEAKATKPEEAAKPTEAKAAKPVYKVQIFSTLKPVPAGDPTFRGLKNCQCTKDGKFYKYTYGEDADYQTILDIQQELKTKFKDCFIVAFLGNKQIPVKEALQMK